MKESVAKEQPSGGSRSSVLRVLTYHRVAAIDNNSILDPRLISATPDTFERQIRHLARHYNVVSMEEVLEAAAGGIRLPERPVLITFDDGYRDFMDYAWPVLKRHRLSSTIFVATAYASGSVSAYWWDRLYRLFYHRLSGELSPTPIGALQLRTAKERKLNLRKLQNYLKTIPHVEAMAIVDEMCSRFGNEPAAAPSTLNWEELRFLKRSGLTLGAHSRTHPLLTKLPQDTVREEVLGSQADLKSEIGDVLPIFCYPDGAHDEHVVSLLKEHGFGLAFTTRDGQNDIKIQDPLRLCRTGITPRTTPMFFRLRLFRWFSHIDAWRHRR